MGMLGIYINLFVWYHYALMVNTLRPFQNHLVDNSSPYAFPIKNFFFFILLIYSRNVCVEKSRCLTNVDPVHQRTYASPDLNEFMQVVPLYRHQNYVCNILTCLMPLYMSMIVPCCPGYFRGPDWLLVRLPKLSRVACAGFMIYIYIYI